MATGAPTRRKSSSLAQLSGNRPPSSPAAPATPTRKRKLQPSPKDRTETYLQAAEASIPRSIKRVKTGSASSPYRIPVVDLTGGETPKKKSIESSPKAGTNGRDGEKRMRPFRKAPPQSYKQKLERAQTQRMIVLNRTRGGTEECPKEDVDIVGSTGNIYTVTIAPSPSCTCPDHLKGNQCKHIVYVLHNVLKGPEDLQYQLAFLSSELREIFSKCPEIPIQAPSSSDDSGNRKPVEGECPICYMDFEEDSNELVWCKAACGNNMHKSCFEQWAASQRGQTVRCVYCRTPWQTDPSDLKDLATTARIGLDGYLNVATQFGLSEERDTSTYNDFWVRRQRRYGGYF